MRGLSDAIWISLREVEKFAVSLAGQAERWVVDGAVITPPLATAFVAILFFLFRSRTVKT